MPPSGMPSGVYQASMHFSSAACSPIGHLTPAAPQPPLILQCNPRKHGDPASSTVLNAKVSCNASLRTCEWSMLHIRVVSRFMYGQSPVVHEVCQVEGAYDWSEEGDAAQSCTAILDMETE